MKILQALADNTNESSLATKLRKKRFSFFLSLFSQVPKPLRLLDVGGTVNFWRQMNFVKDPQVEITLLNLTPGEVSTNDFQVVLGSGCKMNQFKNGEFDIVFSNSVIEHVGDKEAQESMAREITRVGKRYFVQTPNRYFPLEPHFLFPFYQFLPVDWRVWLLQHAPLGWTEKIPDRTVAKRVVESVTLLSKNELCEHFPGAKIYEEKFLGLTKSLIAYDGWS